MNYAKHAAAPAATQTHPANHCRMPLHNTWHSSQMPVMRKPQHCSSSSSRKQCPSPVPGQCLPLQRPGSACATIKAYETTPQQTLSHTPVPGQCLPLLKSLVRHACWSCILQTSSNNASPVPGQCPPPRRPGTACVWAPPSRAAHHPAPAQRRTVLSEQLQPHSRTAHIDESWLICSCHHTRHSRTFTLSATA